ncbi:MAG TPA: translation initiation factor IF-2 [Terrimicrobiaceae bacterium]|jgi:translation initiation factor IF-2|nr:translation initiation factor IF-2 [Terrimicrobiaceae bacterium]
MATTRSEDKVTKPKAPPASASTKKPAAEERPPELAPAPKVPAETLDLLEPKKKVKRKETEGGASKPAIAPIQRIQARPPAKSPVVVQQPPEPVPPAEPPVEAVPEQPESTEASKKVIHLKTSITVKELAPLLSIKPFQVIADLMSLQIFANINQTLELDTVAKLCEKHNIVLEREKKDTSKGHHKPEVKVEIPREPEKPKEEALKPRAPIVTFMGHVDHGKTSLLDAIRKSRVAAGEAGGITQHIGAYSVQRNGQSITFLDTPGHAAFTAMRARGANVTDIVVLVVAADDGLMPQTIEAINHAKAAKVQIMVAINKIDLQSANPDKVKTQLQEKGLTPEDWGGDIICCLVSATKGTGVDTLLDMINLQSEILELKADPRATPRCTVIEAQLEQGRGPTATVIVRMGTLRAGDSFICGNYWGKVKQLINDTGKPVKEAGPAMPVKVLGFSGLPNAGDELVVMENERAARLLSEERLFEIRNSKLAAPQRATLENLFANIAEGQKPTLQIVLKGDVQGSVEALVGALKEIPQTKITLDIIHSAVGPITESDVLLASASNAVIIGFSVKVENNASTVSKREGVQIKLYSIIYELIDQVKEAMAGMLEPELRETVIGHAEVRQVFDLSKGKVAGCYVNDGRISRSARARVLRKKQPIYDGGIATLRRFQDDVKEVRAGLECGIKLGDFSEYLPEDTIECYTLEKVPQQL